jgi:hypothetical protein
MKLLESLLILNRYGDLLKHRVFLHPNP